MESSKQTKRKIFHSPNMNYIYNVEYFDKLQEKKPVSQLNDEICSFTGFANDIENGEMQNPFLQFEGYMGYRSFDLFTQYPGLLMGLGNLHDISEEGAYKLGFSFDYVNGQPYLPGSSLKGLLRSVFPSEKSKSKAEYANYLLGLLKEANILGVEEEDLEELERRIFGSQDGKSEGACVQDIFLGAYPVWERSVEKAYMGTEYITPHKNKTKNPNPISFIKVKPNVCFRFGFILFDDNKMNIKAEQKSELFKRIILDMGVGAKTNVGFGKFTNDPTKVDEKVNEIKRKIKEDNKKKYENRPKNNQQNNQMRSHGKQNNQQRKGSHINQKSHQQQNKNNQKDFGKQQ